MKEHLNQSLAVRTQHQYSHKWHSFKLFMKSHKLGKPIPASPYAISLYITYLYKCGYLTSTIQLHLSAISYKHKLHGIHKDHLPTKSFCIKQLLKSFKKSENHTPKRKPINKYMLSAIINSIDRSNIPLYNKYLYGAAFSLLYHAALRSCELCYTPYSAHSLLLHHIKLKQRDGKLYLKLRLPSYKHSVCKPTPILVRATSSNICPVSLYSQYTQQRGSGSGLAFLHESGAPLTRNQLAQFLKSQIASLGFDPCHYNTHSFRIGKATDMYRAGYSDRQIAISGRWRSNAFLKYIRPSAIAMPT